MSEGSGRSVHVRPPSADIATPPAPVLGFVVPSMKQRSASGHATCGNGATPKPDGRLPWVQLAPASVLSATMFPEPIALADRSALLTPVATQSLAVGQLSACIVSCGGKAELTTRRPASVMR